MIKLLGVQIKSGQILKSFSKSEIVLESEHRTVLTKLEKLRKSLEERLLIVLNKYERIFINFDQVLGIVPKCLQKVWDSPRWF